MHIARTTIVAKVVTFLTGPQASTRGRITDPRTRACPHVRAPASTPAHARACQRPCPHAPVPAHACQRAPARAPACAHARPRAPTGEAPAAQSLYVQIGRLLDSSLQCDYQTAATVFTTETQHVEAEGAVYFRVHEAVSIYDDESKRMWMVKRTDPDGVVYNQLNPADKEL